MKLEKYINYIKLLYNLLYGVKLHVILTELLNRTPIPLIKMACMKSTFPKIVHFIIYVKMNA